MIRPLKIGFAIILAGICLNSYAVTTKVWKQTSQKQFDKGKLDSVSTTSKGDILLAPLAEKLADTDEVYVWAIVSDNEGNIFVGTGNEGKIYKIDSLGNFALLYDSPGIEVLSLAVDRKGNLFAGISPGAVVYKISPEGKADMFCDLPDCYLWCLSFDEMGNLYAGTGNKGRIYRINRRGKAKLIYDSGQSHILCLVIDSGNNLYAGSEPGGIIYRINPKGKASVLYDAPESEIHALALDGNGSLFAGTASGKSMVSPTRRANALHQKKISRSGAPAKAVSNAVYKIMPDGAANCIFRKDNCLILSIAVCQEEVYIGTGNEGLIYKILPDMETTTLMKSGDLQVLSMLYEDDKLYFGTGNMGRVYIIGNDYCNGGLFISPVHDAASLSRWGNISWSETVPYGTEISLQSRSGNTASPDSTWSEWSKNYRDFSGENIESPPGRFIQYNAHIRKRFSAADSSSASPVLHEVAVYYIPINRTPEIESLEIESYDWRMKDVPGISKSRKTKIRKGEKKAVWKAKDPDGDILVFDIYYRGSEEKNWKKLKENLKENYYCWDTVIFPDGCYLLKLTASDRPDNPPSAAKTDEKISLPFTVDNTPPVVEKLEPEYKRITPDDYVITGTAHDNTSDIARIEYSVDAEDWVNIFPVDGIFDSKTEFFEFSLQDVSEGEHTVVVKTTDSQGNVGTGKVVFEASLRAASELK